MIIEKALRQMFLNEFTFRKRKEKLAEIHNSIRANAKDDFLKSVINGSEKQRKIAVEQSKKLVYYLKKLESIFLLRYII